jgi:hypothetical protein
MGSASTFGVKLAAKLLPLTPVLLQESALDVSGPVLCCAVLWHAVACCALQMREMVAKTEQDAIPVSDVVRVVMEAATAPQPKVS